jgi:hypothetical protein
MAERVSPPGETEQRRSGKATHYVATIAKSAHRQRRSLTLDGSRRRAKTGHSPGSAPGIWAGYGCACGMSKWLLRAVTSSGGLSVPLLVACSRRRRLAPPGAYSGPVG